MQRYIKEVEGKDERIRAANRELLVQKHKVEVLEEEIKTKVAEAEYRIENLKAYYSSVISVNAHESHELKSHAQNLENLVVGLSKASK